MLRRGAEVVTLTPEIRAFLLAPDPLIVTKANVKTRVHRRDYMDYVGVKIFAAGKVKGELRIVGLFTSTAFTQSAERIPLIRRKVAEIVQRAGLDPFSHSGKALLNILENYPRTELFQAEIGRTLRVRHGDPATRGAPAHPCAVAPRPLRPLRLGARLRSARPLRLRPARADRRGAGGAL